MNKSLLSTRNSGRAHVSTLRRCVIALSAGLVFLACFVASLFIIGPNLVGFTPLGGVSFCFLLAFLSFQIAKAFKRYCYKRFCFRNPYDFNPHVLTIRWSQPLAVVLRKLRVEK